MSFYLTSPLWVWILFSVKNSMICCLVNFYDESKTVIISTHQVAEVENILQDVIFIDKGSIIVNESVDALKDRWHIYEVPQDQEETLMQYNPKVVTKTLGHVRALVEGKVDISDSKK